MRLLVVDDAVHICTGIRDGIPWQAHGIEQVFVAFDGKSALELFEEQAPEIVITDIRMACLDGIQLSREILLRKPETRIILLSAYSEFEYAKEALKIGVFSYELKPVKIEELVRRVEEAQAAWNDLVAKNSAEQQLLKIKRERRLQRILRGEERETDAAAFLHESFALELEGRYLCAVFKTWGEAVPQEVLLGMIRQADGSYLIETDGIHAAVFSCTCSLLYVEKRIADIQKLLRSAQPFAISCGVSTHGSLTDIAALYRQALAAEKLSFYAGPNTANRWNGECELLALEIPPCRKDFFEIGRGMALKWDQVNRQIEAVYDQLRRSKQRYAPESVHAFTLELMRNLKHNMHKWIGEDDPAIAQAVKRLEQRPILHEFAEYQRAAVELYQNVFTEYMGEGKEVTNSFAARCKFYINHHYQENLMVQEMADYFGITPNYFSYLFKKNIGVSFKKYLNEVRIKAANELLAQGQMQAAEIALRVGFVDYKYFHQVYRKYMGCAPTQK